MLFCRFPCIKTSRSLQLSGILSGDCVSYLSRDLLQKFVPYFSELLLGFLYVFLKSSLFLKYVFLKGPQQHWARGWGLNWSCTRSRTWVKHWTFNLRALWDKIQWRALTAAGVSCCCGSGTM